MSVKSPVLSSEEVLNALKAAGESTRLRLLALLKDGELNVKDLTRILGQSQPRISRHLKLLHESGLIERFREGSWVYFRLSENQGVGKLVRNILSELDPAEPEILRDKSRAAMVKQERADIAQGYFREHAAEWDKIRSLYLSENDVEQAMQRVLGDDELGVMVDLGTGTGRILELFASQIERGVGVDMNPDMLAYARSKLEDAGLDHCQVRYGDIFNIPLEDDFADVVILHQVLHFVADPAVAISEAERILNEHGRLVIVDFAPHDMEFLREDHAHQRLGFTKEYLKQCMEKSGLRFTDHLDLPTKGAGNDNELTVSIWMARKIDKNIENSEHTPDVHGLDSSVDRLS